MATDKYVHKYIHYSLLLKSSHTSDPTGTVWKLIQVLNEMGENFAPGFLHLGAGRLEVVTIDNPRVVASILQDPRLRYGSQEELGVSFSLKPART